MKGMGYKQQIGVGMGLLTGVFGSYMIWKSGVYYGKNSSLVITKRSFVYEKWNLVNGHSSLTRFLESEAPSTEKDGT